ncbi:hypothetical protein [Streptomyces cavernicola]|uniref:SMI1/KNR4 family protein n=1 Tax=Streptomyces cavernicola TaxID=3043613 RepID=A0ABT6SKB6_9ACTN|nr:hypothetical protein [Streptomyces sp. B-S-A6]MDI3408294.1 hypothetical protein [Streptomyces sp. B-S-A6]
MLDGASCSPSLQLFGLAEAEEHQFYCGPVVDSPLELSPEKLFCIGMTNEAPVFLDRAGGAVLGTPEAGADWPDAERFEQLAPGLAFFLERLATEEYVRLAGIDDEHPMETPQSERLPHAAAPQTARSRRSRKVR